jgi:hypothetical protein
MLLDGFSGQFQGSPYEPVDDKMEVGLRQVLSSFSFGFPVPCILSLKFLTHQSILSQSGADTVHQLQPVKVKIHTPSHI